jgi:hypothetical protein
VLIGAGIGFLYIPCLPVQSQWFNKRRSLTNGINAAGSGVDGAAFAWGTEATIQRLGIGWVLRITGNIAFTVNTVAMVFIKDRNKAIRPSQLGSNTKLLRRYEVLLLLVWVFISMLGYVVLLLSLLDFALSIGLDRRQADDIIGLLSVGAAIRRLVIEICSNPWSRMDTAVCGISYFTS